MSCNPQAFLPPPLLLRWQGGARLEIAVDRDGGTSAASSKMDTSALANSCEVAERLDLGQVPRRAHSIVWSGWQGHPQDASKKRAYVRTCDSYAKLHIIITAHGPMELWEP